MNIEQIINIFRQSVAETIYRHYEYGCDTNLTDEDMLKIKIDWALENGDKEMFMKLTEQLKELSV